MRPLEPIMDDGRGSTALPIVLLVLMLGWAALSPVVGMLFVLASDACPPDATALICTTSGQDLAGRAPMIGACGGVALAVLALVHRPMRFVWSVLSFLPGVIGLVVGASIAATAP